MLHLTLHAQLWVGCVSVRAVLWEQDESGGRTLLAKSVEQYYDPRGNVDDFTEVISAVERWAAGSLSNGITSG